MIMFDKLKMNIATENNRFDCQVYIRYQAMFKKKREYLWSSNYSHIIIATFLKKVQELFGRHIGNNEILRKGVPVMVRGSTQNNI